MMGHILGTNDGLPQCHKSSHSPSTLAISVQDLGKAYRIYDAPQDRLKQMLFARFGKSYGRNFWALRHVSFSVHKGERLGIIGRNGSGKSTLLQILAGTLTPSEGEVNINGKVAALLELGSGFNPEFTGRENVFLNGSILGLSQHQVEERFDEIAAFADIGKFIDQPVKTYSSGMFVRLAFAVTTSMDADILLIDEALAVGDVFFRQKCYKRLEKLVNNGVSILLVSHTMTEVEQFCQRGVLLNEGLAAFVGGSSEAVKHYYLLEQTNHPTQPDIPSSASTLLKSVGSFPQPSQEAFFDISKLSQISNGWARCLSVALVDEMGNPCRGFQQGECAVFYYEFELLHPIEVPIGGLVIQNEKGIVVHGKSTLEYGSEVPLFVPQGSKLSFRQEVKLELGLGEYTFEVGLAAMSQKNYEQRAIFPQQEMRAKYTRLCHVPGVGPFAVLFRQTGAPVRLLHHGIANLPGHCQTSLENLVTSYNHDESESIDKKLLPTLIEPFENKQDLTIFHVTHWKAGSQWVNKILLQCAPARVVFPQVDNKQFFDQPLHSGSIYPTLYLTKEEFDSVLLPNNWRRFVVIRDLRDTLISAYFSIKISHPVIDVRITNWRSNLLSLNMEEGLIYLIEEWLPLSAVIQESWASTGEKMVHYEDLLENDIEILEKVLLEDCQLSISRQSFHEIVSANRFTSLTNGRDRGQEDLFAHERKGIAGDWKNHFTGEVKRVFKQKYGNLLLSTGYECNHNW